jgi:hypothetical protein
VRAVDQSHALANAAVSLFISAARIASFDWPYATDCYHAIEMQETSMKFFDLTWMPIDCQLDPDECRVRVEHSKRFLTILQEEEQNSFCPFLTGDES